MSTVSIPARVSSTRVGTTRLAGVRRPTRRPAARLTRRGRVIFLALALLLVLGAMVALAGFATAGRHAGTPDPVKVVEVKPGDTLYRIAGDLAEPGKVGDMVYRIEQLNSLPGPELQVGQKIAIPVG